MVNNPIIITPCATISTLSTREEGIDLLRIIEHYGRISHRSEDAQTLESWGRFINAVVVNKGDWSITEHASVTVDATVDRGVMAEWTRHRMLQFTIESSRFVRYGTKRPLAFIQPQDMSPAALVYWDAHIRNSIHAYDALLMAGESPQISRSVLPMALATRLICTANLRSWRHILLMRTTKEAHPAMRQIMIPLLGEFQEKIPLLYDDIIPNQPQRDTLQRPR